MALPMESRGVTQTALLTPPGRDLRLDVFRGLALMMIFINHVPGTAWEYATNRNFGFSDAAEGFVIMSGIAAGLAYGRVVSRDGIFAGALRCWRRAFTLYWVHITTTMLALGISALAARAFGVTEMIEINNVKAVFGDLEGALIGLPLMTHQLGYFNILPLYCVLLLSTPWLIALAYRSPALLAAGSVGLWFAAGLWRLNLPNYPVDGGWFFNPFAWQLIFVVGLMTGLALKEGRRFVPVNRRLFWAAVGYLAFSLAWMKVPFIMNTGREVLHALYDLGLPFHIISFDKTFLATPRLLHALALLYVVSCLPAAVSFARARWSAPLALMGRHALPVFALGSVLSILGQAVEKGTEAGFALDTLILATGILLQFLFACAFEWRAGHDGRARSVRPALVGGLVATPAE